MKVRLPNAPLIPAVASSGLQCENNEPEGILATMTQRDNLVTRRATELRATNAPGDPQTGRELRGMLSVLEQLGYNLEKLLVSTGIRRSDFENPEAYISPSACALVFAHARQERRVKNLALQLAMHTPIGSSPLLDYLIVSAESVGKGLQRLVKYLRLVNPGVRLSVKDDRDPVRVVVENSAGPFEVELTVALSVLRFARETNSQLRAAYASFDHELDDAAEFERVLRCPVRTNARWNGWALSQSAMQLPLRRSDPTLGRWLEQRASETLSRLPRNGDIRDEVRRVLSSQVTAGELSLSIVARRLTITARTLQRRLERSGTSFEALRDETRKKASEIYLADPRLSISEIAYLIGFSEPAAFHRAFKRWHRTTPQRFRGQHK